VKKIKINKNKKNLHRGKKKIIHFHKGRVYIKKQETLPRKDIKKRETLPHRKGVKKQETLLQEKGVKKNEKHFHERRVLENKKHFHERRVIIAHCLPDDIRIKLV
jgi:hypothetical protein